MAKSFDRHIPLYLCLIVVLATGLRAIGVGLHPLWGDEALTIVISEWSIRDMILLPTDPTPFFYYALHKLLFAASDSAALIRMISVVSGVASILCMYLLGRICFDTRTGLISALLLSVSTIHIDYSIDARAYALAMFFTLIMSTSLMKYFDLIRTPSGSNHARMLCLFLFALSSVLSFYTHITAVFWIVATNLILLFFSLKAGKAHYSEIIATWILMLVLALPGIYRLSLQLRYGDSFSWLEQANFARLIANLAEVYLPIGLWDNSITRSNGITSVVKIAVISASTIVVSILLASGWKSFKSRATLKPEVMALIAAYLIVPLAIWLFGYVMRPIFMARAVMFCLPGFLLVVAAMVSYLPYRSAAFATVGLTLVSLISVALQGFAMPKPAWDQAARVLEENVKEGDAILICPEYAYPALRHAASKPLSAPILSALPDGKLQILESGLGKNEAWSQAYYRALLIPSYYTNHTQERRAESYDAAPVTVAGYSNLWIVNICKAERAREFTDNIDRMSGYGDIIWQDRLGELSVSRRNISEDATLPAVQKP